MAEIVGSSLSSSLAQFLKADTIEPGSAPSYQLCKDIYLFHPLGGKMAEAPVALAQSQERKISLQTGPEAKLRDAFLKERRALKIDEVIFRLETTKRIYGIATLAMIVEGQDASRPLDYDTLWKQDISFSIFDPLTTSGSLVFSQNPNAVDYMKSTGSIRVSGQEYHRDRCIIELNGQPIYLAYTVSAYGFVGRSCYQRAIYPLKSFVQSMITDDMVTLKSGVIVAKMKAAGSIVSENMIRLFRGKAAQVKQAQTSNVITISPEEAVETLNMQNLDGAYGQARTNILKNIATADDMPAILLENETLVSGFGEGSEDAKIIAQYANRTRLEMANVYAWTDKIVQRRAWNPEFYKEVQKEFPEYAGKDYQTAIHEWADGFRAQWPNFLEEPDSEKAKMDDVRLKAAVALLEVLGPMIDPVNKTNMIGWACDCFNELKLLFPGPLNLDLEELLEFLRKQQKDQEDLVAQGGAVTGPGGAQKGPSPPKPFSATS